MVSANYSEINGSEGIDITGDKAVLTNSISKNNAESGVRVTVEHNTPIQNLAEKMERQEYKEEALV